MIKKTASVIIALFLIWTAVMCINVSAEEYDSINEAEAQMNEILSEYGTEETCEELAGFSFADILSNIKTSLAERITAPLRVLKTLIAVVIFTAMMRNAGEAAITSGSGLRLYDLVCVLTVVTAVSPMLFEAYANTVTAVENGGNFMFLFVPLYASVTLASGGITTAGIYNATALLSAEFMVQTAENILLPLVGIMTALAVIGGVFPNGQTDGLLNLIKKAVTWIMTAGLTLFSGFITLKCTLGSRTDGFAAKTAKFVISGCVPIVGGAVSDAYSSVRGSLELMRCSIGFAGTAGIVIMLIPPVVELAAFRGAILLSAASAELFSEERLAKLLRNIDSGLSIAMSILISFGVLFIVSTGTVMKMMY